MSTRSLLVAVGLMVLMLGALSFLQKKVPGTERMAKEARRITDLPVRDADRIELKGPKGDFAFRKKGEGAWDLEKPIQGAADGTTVGRLLSEVQFVESLQTLPPGKKEGALLQSFGLGQPTRTLVIRTKEGELRVETGRDTPIPGGVYARIQSAGQGERIAVVQNQLAEAMDKDLTEWREKRVMPLPVSDVQELLLHQGTLEVEVKKKEGKWSILKPVEAPADPTAVEGVLGEISALKATRFISDFGGDLALYGLNAPAQSFETRWGGTNRILQIGLSDPKETNQVFAKVADQTAVFLLPKPAIEGLGKMADRVRDRRLVTLGQAGQIDSVEFSGKGEEYRLEKLPGGTGWRLLFGASSRSADGARVDKWLDSLMEIRANRFLPTEDPARMGLTKPRQSITLKWGGATNRVETIQLGDETKEEVFVRGSTTSGAMVVPVALARGIPESRLGWLPKKLIPSEFGPVEGLIWSVGGNRKEYRAGADGRWKARSGDAEAAPVSNFVSRLDGLEVERWTGVPSKAELGKSEVEIVLEGKGDKRLKLTVSKGKGDGGAVVRLEGQEVAGLLDRTAVGWLRQDPGVAQDKPAQR
ncbi:MAG: DUF4340 domain-containing protein [Verrucomicrobia bacterium]|nr:DUF4340 domain-containing protein [Verrucomicrobiota bacterium]NBS79427.1 DUF4340 domain-containing protein [bacterium]NBT23856.1 DUF4340 domain-containing protein [bacterium]NBV96849.1 DUF4340 domain-containing protein [Verrucomicrobiota bacterium]NBY65787.1 DUF4340 domain-containing protein [Verrucomicrobiota bacterium]